MLRDALVEQRDVGQAEAGAQRHLNHTHMRDPSFPVGRLLCLIAQKRRQKRNAAHAQSTGWSVLWAALKSSHLLQAAIRANLRPAYLCRANVNVCEALSPRVACCLG